MLTYIAPQAAHRPAFFDVSAQDKRWVVAVDPYTAHVMQRVDPDRTVRAIAEDIHGTLLIGDLGDRLIETAASLTVILIVTGIYLWWPRQGGVLPALLPDFSLRGRGFWREIHKAIGVWTALILLLFTLSGLSWAGIWGERYAKPWGSFPTTKWDNVPLSHQTHASLNHTAVHEVPWTLESTPLPASGSAAGAAALSQPVTLDTVASWARAHGFSGQYKLSVPTSDEGVFTVAYDARNQDSASPSGDRFVHIDQYTGNVLADVRFADYPLLGKVMAWGIALHKGMAGWFNFAFNLVYLALTVLLCVSGVVMWWKRRPVGSLGAPQLPKGFRLTAGRPWGRLRWG
ncbi:MAG: PepSY domain-containing protein [Burkholderiaceae bacterium]